MRELTGWKRCQWNALSILLGVFLTLVFSVPTASGIVVWRTLTTNGGGIGVSNFDLNEDGFADIYIDYSLSNVVDGDGPFRLQTFGPTLVSASGGITLSYSAGDVVELENGSWVGSGINILTAGVVLDALGNVVVDGWGGIAYDHIGNPIIPPSGPTFQTDLFLVRLSDGVAWIDLDTSGFALGSLTLDWCFLSPVTSTFVIAAIPEPNVTLMIALTSCLGMTRSRKSK